MNTVFTVCQAPTEQKAVMFLCIPVQPDDDSGMQADTAMDHMPGGYVEWGKQSQQVKC